jgi:hypothetical protein
MKATLMKITEMDIIRSNNTLLVARSPAFMFEISPGGEPDMAEHIKKSTEKLYYRNLPFHPLAFLKPRLGSGRENFSPTYQKALFAKRIATYGAFVAVKPKL